MPRMQAAFATVVISSILAPIWAPHKPEYLRIVSGPHTIFVQHQAGTMRLANSIAGLAVAKPIAAAGQSVDRNVASASFTEVALRLPPQARPAGCTHLGGLFNFNRYAVRPSLLLPALTEIRTFVATIQLVVRDSKGVDWAYLAVASDQTGDTAANAPAVQVPDPGAMKMTMVARALPVGIGIALDVTAGRARIASVSRNGRNVVAQVAIRDAKGRLVASRSGDLSEFGLDDKGQPKLTVPVTGAGLYTITATLVAGPGVSLTARKSVIVP